MHWNGARENLSGFGLTQAVQPRRLEILDLGCKCLIHLSSFETSEECTAAYKLLGQPLYYLTILISFFLGGH